MTTRRVIDQIRWLLLIPLAAGLVSCASAEDEPAQPADTKPEVEVPAEVVSARDAVLDFLHQASTICVPPEGVPWTPAQAGDEIPVGFSAYYFTAEDCTITVTYVQDTSAKTYHVDANNPVTGCCWQAQVDSSGHIVKTGDHAGADPDPGNPASVYCTEQGFEYQVRTNPETGCVCSACIFPDGSMCQAWEYFRGQCEPGATTADNGG